MKLLIFAHTPPPHHGQSYMVQLMLNGLGGDHRHRQPGQTAPGDHHGIQCYHVNTRFSKRLEDIGEFHGIKLLRLLFYCLEAIWCRFRHSVTNFYYIPAPGKKSALYRDWLVLFLCRPFFNRVILHWHAAGLAKWLETSVLIRSRALTYHFAKAADLSIVLSRYNIADAEKLLPRNISIVGNGIPDPCVRFQQTILPKRLARFAARKKILERQELSATDLGNTNGNPHVFNVLFLAHCMEEKGLFDTVRAVILANRRLAAQDTGLKIKLTVAGSFVSESEQQLFDQLCTDPELDSAIEYRGFVTGSSKEAVFEAADCFCFPSYYYAESFGLVLVEAMAFGLPIVTTHWRSLPELLPPDYPGLVAIKSPDQIAAALLNIMTQETGVGFRELFLARFTIEAHLTKLAAALTSVEHPAPAPAPESLAPAR